jgi:hypothetical protein
MRPKHHNALLHRSAQLCAAKRLHQPTSISIKPSSQPLADGSFPLRFTQDENNRYYRGNQVGTTRSPNQYDRANLLFLIPLIPGYTGPPTGHAGYISCFDTVLIPRFALNFDNFSESIYSQTFTTISYSSDSNFGNFSAPV